MIKYLFFTLMVFLNSLFGVTEIEIAPKRVTPGTVLNISIKTFPNDQIKLEFFRGNVVKGQSVVPSFSMNISDASKTSGYTFGDLDDSPGFIRAKISIPFTSSDRSHFGEWTVFATDSSGNKKSDSFTIIQFKQVKQIEKSWADLTIDRIIELIKGIRGTSKYFRLCVVDKDGTFAPRVYKNIKYHYIASPSWSPQNDKIIFAAKNKGEKWKILIVDDWRAKNPNPRVLVDGTSPVWSPKGENVAYIDRNEIKVIDTNTKSNRTILKDVNPTRLLKWRQDDEIIFTVAIQSPVPELYLPQVEISPSTLSSQLSSSDVSQTKKSIYSFNTKTGLYQSLPYHSFFDLLSGISYDDKFSVFAFEKSGRSDIWNLELQGFKPKQITSDDYIDQDPSLSPDNKYIVFSSDRP